jgi:hypothetical protein
MRAPYKVLGLVVLCLIVAALISQAVDDHSIETNPSTTPDQLAMVIAQQVFGHSNVDTVIIEGGLLSVKYRSTEHLTNDLTRREISRKAFKFFSRVYHESRFINVTDVSLSSYMDSVEVSEIWMNRRLAMRSRLDIDPDWDQFLASLQVDSKCYLVPALREK